jgi:hypothetical protein
MILFGIEIKFLGPMKCVIFMKGGNLWIESLKIIKQKWIEPLIDVYAVTSSIVLNFFLNNITKCDYGWGESSSLYKSGVIFVSDLSSEKMILNISYCFFYENTFNLFYDENSFGNGFHFAGTSILSGLKYIFFFFFSSLLEFYISDCNFTNYIVYYYCGGVNFFFFFFI